MPTVFIIDGVTITLNFDEHPHHTSMPRIAEHRAAYLLDGSLMNGSLPGRKDTIVREWAQAHLDDLEKAWNACLDGRNPGRIDQP